MRSFHNGVGCCFHNREHVCGHGGELKQRYPSDISVYSWYKEVPADVNLDDALKEAAADSDKIIADSACNVKDSKSYTYFSWTVFREGTEFKPVLSYDNDISLLYFVTGDEIDEMETGFKERLNKKSHSLIPVRWLYMEQKSLMAI